MTILAIVLSWCRYSTKKEEEEERRAVTKEEEEEEGETRKDPPEEVGVGISYRKLEESRQHTMLIQALESDDRFLNRNKVALPDTA